MDALHRMPPHDENAGHCFNRAFYDAAAYMRRAGKRVVVVASGLWLVVVSG